MPPEVHLCVIALQFRANPGKYPDAGLTTYLPEAEKLGLADEDIIMDMHQMVCVGAYGGVTSAVCPFPSPSVPDAQLPCKRM